MKIEVLTNLDVNFSRFRFYSDWIDICVYRFEEKSYLLQMKINKFNGKKFRSIKISKRGAFGVETDFNLTQSKGIND